MRKRKAKKNDIEIVRQRNELPSSDWIDHISFRLIDRSIDQKEKKTDLTKRFDEIS